MPLPLQDIAKKAENSHSTGSSGPNYHLATPRETVERIQRLTRGLNRLTNRFVCSFKTSRSHMWGIFIHRVADSFYRELQNMSHSLIIGCSFFTPAYLNVKGIHVRTVIHHHKAEILLRLIFYENGNARSTKIAFAGAGTSPLRPG
jgi:hypothetical protein